MASGTNASIGAQLGEAYYQVCVSELQALKPGNVHRYAPGHGMTMEDFLKSAEVSRGPISELRLGMGERIYQAVLATRKAVACNTNLGILLLSGPLIQAVLEADGQGSLRQRLRCVLELTDSEDTRWINEAISMANPGGLGKSSRHDVRGSDNAPLMEVMAYAAEWDRIAWMYVTGFSDLFEYGKPLFGDLQTRWGDQSWATSALYMKLLSRFPDTHIQRKYGYMKASEISARAKEFADRLVDCEYPEQYHGPLLALDSEFKKEGINPGTTADLTVAVLLLVRLEKILSQFETKTGFSRTRGYGQGTAINPNSCTEKIAP